HRRLPSDELKIVVGLFASLPRTVWQPLLDRSTNTDQLRDAIAQLVESGAIDDELASMGLRRPGVGSAARPDDDDVVWYDDHLIERIMEAAPDEILAIEHAGRVTELAFDRVIKRGAASLVLGEDLDTGDQTAIRLD